MVDRVSALDGHYKTGKFGNADSAGIYLREIPNLVLHQVGAWPQTLTAVGQQLASLATTSGAPGPAQALVGSDGIALLRVEPLKWWILGAAAPELDAQTGVTLDISHSRTHISIAGPDAALLLSRHLPLDLREVQSPAGTVVSTAFHHVGVTLWRTETDFQMFVPRGFAVALWEMLNESALQFGFEVT